jgi:hypothetical protein
MIFNILLYWIILKLLYNTKSFCYTPVFFKSVEKILPFKTTYFISPYVTVLETDLMSKRLLSAPSCGITYVLLFFQDTSLVFRADIPT